VERIAEEGIATRLFAGNDARRIALLVFDLAHRFMDASALAGALSEGNFDARRDRVFRATLRALTGSR
jgi:hypothetical protein